MKLFETFFEVSFRHFAEQVQLTLEQRGFGLHESTYSWIVSNRYCKCISSSYDCLNIIFSLAYFIVRVQFIIHI